MKDSELYDIIRQQAADNGRDTEAVAGITWGDLVRVAWMALNAWGYHQERDVAEKWSQELQQAVNNACAALNCGEIEEAEATLNEWVIEEDDDLDEADLEHDPFFTVDLLEDDYDIARAGG